MIKKYNNSVIIFVVITYLMSISIPTFAQQQSQLNSKNLESDLKYYYKISQQQKLSANDKLYILNRIYEKYKNTEINLTKLQKEINKVKQEIQKEVLQNKNANIIEAKTQTFETQNVENSVNEERYKISSGDVLFIQVFPSEELSTEVVVTPDGKIVLPLIGALKAEGLTIKELKKDIENSLSIYISNPTVNIIVKYFSKKQIFIMGEIKNPGGYQYREGLKLLELISQAGGVTPYAGVRNIKIYRGGKEKQEIINVDLQEIFSDTSKDILLQPADIVEVPRQPKSISVIGAVNQSGSFDWYEGIDILKAISLARGHTDVASLSKVRIFREKTVNEKEVILVDVKKLLNGDLTKNISLQPGDVVYVPRKFLVTGQWFVNTVLPWLTLITTILVLINYTK
ncbi:MAG: polysaccharide biosynthesis/export family protein [Endomicrobiia bacterium]